MPASYIAQPEKIMLIHGVGEPLDTEDWSKPWVEKLAEKFRQFYPKMPQAEFCRASYHDLFEADFREEQLDADDLIHALATLGWAKMTQQNGGLLRGTRGLSALVEALRWTAAMIVRWSTDEDLRERLRKRIRDVIETEQPTIIAAHSLGSLIAYDLFLKDPGVIHGRTFISFGSQIGNAFVRNVFNGRLSGLPGAEYWLHLYNSNDSLFTAEIRLHGTDTLSQKGIRNFYQIQTPFNNLDPLDHTAVSTGAGTVGYLDTFEAIQLVWPRAFKYGPRHDAIRRTIRRAVSRATETPDHRALLIGIDHYRRDDIPALTGCTNDTYLISQALQEESFPVQNIRMLHNDRATAAAIRDRIDWLLDDVDDGEFRLLYFSGHGHQLESYGANESADRLDECLCPYDYDYSVNTAILDDHLYNLYAQLPYASQLVVILDCCHSGGMARTGAQRVRGLAAPMDVAHRGLFWSADKDNGGGIWDRRSMTRKKIVAGDNTGKYEAGKKPFLINPSFPGTVTTPDQESAYVGKSQTTRRLFRALSLRQGHATDTAGDRDARAKMDGPYLPVILQACGENSLAQEHTDGMASYGAFTFCLSRIFRSLKPLTFSDPRIRDWSEVIERTRKSLADLGYDQVPELLAPVDQNRIAFHLSK